VDHAQHPEQVNLTLGAVVDAAGGRQGASSPLADRNGVIRCEADDPLSGSAAAGGVMLELLGQPVAREPRPPVVEQPPRIGVFICRCAGEIDRVLDTEALCRRAGAWPQVAHAGLLASACAAEAAGAVRRAVREHRLNRLVVAACSCCSIEQVCFSCTFQRLRCKQNFGLLPGGESGSRLPATVEMVNIREHCARVHSGDPPAANAKAAALVAAATAGVRRAAGSPAGAPPPAAPEVFVLGSGPAASVCLQALGRQGIRTRHRPEPARRIERSAGCFRMGRETAAAVVITPSEAAEAARIFARLPAGGPPGGRREADGGALPPDLFYCPPGGEPQTAGLAVAARVVARLRRSADCPPGAAARVDAERCRACGSCVESCEAAAVEILEEDGRAHARVDAMRCNGCGSCAARCPTNAIGFEIGGDGRIEAMLEALLT
jgi:NAD-dependent dihydropyrimidine dehydrogenase PreA subunit